MNALTSRRGLYAIVDPEFCAGRSALEVAKAILDGGCAILQLRAKHLASGELHALACSVRDLCRAAGVPFVVNDFVELAQRVGADGVHLGQGDLPVAEARAILGPEIAIGVSTHDLAQAKRAFTVGADMIGFGPIFATTSKDRPAPVVGLDGLREVCSVLDLPIVAIGGITLERASSVAATGARLGAAISAVCSVPDPREAARRLHRALGG